MTLRLRELSGDERVAVRRIARSHTPEAGMVRRPRSPARLINGPMGMRA